MLSLSKPIDFADRFDRRDPCARRWPPAAAAGPSLSSTTGPDRRPDADSVRRYVSCPSWMIRPASIGWPRKFAGLDDIEDLVERHDDVLKLAQAPGTAAGSERPWSACPERRSSGRGATRASRGSPGDDHRAVIVAHARAAGAQDVLIGQIGIGMQAERGQLQFAGKSPAVERFDIDQLVLEPIAARSRSCPSPGHRT